jgi:hypothetical protein
MHEFWYFSFMTAKHWGSRREQWTAEDLWQDFPDVLPPNLLAPTPPGDAQLLGSRSPQLRYDPTVMPSALCRWSIHISENQQWVDVTDVPDVLSDAMPQQPTAGSLDQTLQDGLESNSFSTIPASQLPVDLGLVSRAARKSQDQIWEESFGFAIMSGNYELVDMMMRAQNSPSKRKLRSIHPAHLAAAYLNGAKSCCLIMNLLSLGAGRFEREAFDRDNNGHTVLDILMLRILHSHSRVRLDTISDSLRGVQGTVGEVVDICGRWDAESNSYRKLVGGGIAKVPLDWKHKFCHTSIQAVCHCIIYVTQLPSRTLETTGLFTSRCFDCGLLLELSPLTALVFTAWHLLKESMDGEDLFGMICCLFQLLVSLNERINFSTSPVSTRLFQGDMNYDTCAHEELSPWEVAMKLNATAQQSGCPETQKGWQAFVAILEQVEEQHRWVSEACPPAGYEEQHEEILRAYRDNPGDNLDDDTVVVTDTLHQEIFCDGNLAFPTYCEHDTPRAFGRNTCLGHIWAACQAELLTYRRQKEGDLWLSQHLTMDAILECLRTGDPEALPHVRKKMLEAYCACGAYGGWSDVVLREDACCSDF